MKRKKDILVAIENIRDIRDGYKYLGDKTFSLILNEQIRILRWVLGYKGTTGWYYCAHCEIRHRNLRCPKCGNDGKVRRMVTK